MVKIHLAKQRPSAFGGTTYGTLCNRLRTLQDGMNCTDKEEEVSCKFCLKVLEIKNKGKAA